MIKENQNFLSKQLITYIGNKRALLGEIQTAIQIVQKELKKEKLVCLDLFSGSGVVARLLKQFSETIIANDLEEYSKIINDCFLSNKKELDIKKYNKYLLKINKLIEKKPITNGIIRANYSPVDDKDIQINDRVFYTNENAIYIDSFRYYIDKVVPNKYKKYFIALLLVESSIHVNTAGVFKGFYKDPDTKTGKFGGKSENALNRIKGKINISIPHLSDFESNYEVYQKDAIELAGELKNLDFVYLDPPYNEHPYGSNYFMLNIIAKNEMPNEISRVSGIPKIWNRSIFNKKKTALRGLKEIIQRLDAKYILVSYNNEGLIGYNEIKNMLSLFGKLEEKIIKYNTFKGSRNLKNRDTHTKEYLFLLQKEEACI